MRLANGPGRCVGSSEIWGQEIGQRCLLNIPIGDVRMMQHYYTANVATVACVATLQISEMSASALPHLQAWSPRSLYPKVRLFV